jgi:phosphoglycerate dehydrogenase-like enzyme
MKIYLITSNPSLSESMKKRLQSLGDFMIIDAEKLTKNEIISKASDAEILIVGSSGVENISKEILNDLKNLKMIATLTVGVSWIDLQAAKDLGIIVCNVKGANSESVAEHAWGLILDLSKRITEFDRSVRNDGAFKFGEFTGKEVYGKTLGIIGLGNIGTKVARIAKGFDMKILGFNRSQKNISNVIQVDKETLLKESDVIVICLPLTTDTVDFISDKEISLMKTGVILVNTAMEPITNQSAVLKGLHGGKIFGFGIETEIMKPIPTDSPYFKHPQVVVTPHNAFNTEDANIKTYELAISNIEAFIKGQPQNIVN